MIRKEITIQNEQGFHVRPAQMFADRANMFRAAVKVIGESGEADGKSMLELMTLGLVKGARIILETDGPDESEAMRALTELVEGRFGEA
jgi:phosphocarrier protein HPr/phosphocarrier protein